MDRTELTLLGIAALLVVIVIAFFSFWEFSRELTKGLCQDSDGAWNGTECLCSSSFQCPPGFCCSSWEENGTGMCRPLSGR
jgi:hypothetical protein